MRFKSEPVEQDAGVVCLLMGGKNIRGSVTLKVWSVKDKLAILDLAQRGSIWIGQENSQTIRFNEQAIFKTHILLCDCRHPSQKTTTVTDLLFTSASPHAFLKYSNGFAPP